MKKIKLFSINFIIYVCVSIISICILNYFIQNPSYISHTRQEIKNLNVQIDPYKLNPLSALITFDTKKPAVITLKIHGKDGAADITHTFRSSNPHHHEIPVLGLYPNYLNQITLTANFTNKTQEIKNLYIKTTKIPKRALINVLKKEDTKTRYYFLYDGVVFDEDGYIRFSFNGKGNIIYKMGNELISESRTGGITRFTMLGKEIKHYSYPKGFVSFTHGIGQKPNGNFLVIGSFDNTMAIIKGNPEKTHREFVIELDYQTGEMVNKIDFAEILNPNRSVIIPADQKDYGANDWCHINAVDYDKSDNSIVISCRHIGMVKVNEKTKELIWLFGPNKGYEQSGRDGKGPAISDKVLTAIDKNKKPFSQKFQIGEETNHAFKWPTKTHHARVVGNGIFSIFDNSGPVYDQTIHTTPEAHASVFFIDEQNKTVEQIWKQNLGVSSVSASSVIYSPEQKEVYVYIADAPDKNQIGMSQGLLRRYDMDTHKILFEASVYRGGASWFYRAENFVFYPQE